MDQLFSAKFPPQRNGGNNLAYSGYLISSPVQTIELYGHCLKWAKRIISTDKVELILSDPDGIIKQSRDKFIYYKKLKGRTDNLIAAVTLIKSNNFFEVITLMIDFEVQ